MAAGKKWVMTRPGGRGAGCAGRLMKWLAKWGEDEAVQSAPAAFFESSGVSS
jgi:hypothetical protein